MRRWIPACAVLILLGAGTTACAVSGDEEAGGGPATRELGAATPSDRAVEVLGAPSIERIRGVAAEHDLDWTVLAAVALLEDVDPADVESIAYSLLATGAPDSYEVALAARGGPGFAADALRIADRLRSSADVEVGERATLPLTVPVDGVVVARFGRIYGLLHDGVDIEAEIGTPVRAAGPGVVTSAGFDSAFGNRTCITHRVEADRLTEDDRPITTCYGNQSAIDVEPGEVVRRGQTIGAVGCSGPCLRPHLHLQVKEGGSPQAQSVDPAPYFGNALAGGDAKPLDR